MKPSLVADIRHHLQKISDPKFAEQSQRYFKTGPGEYGAGDTFIGVRVPLLRGISKRHRDLPLNDAESLLQSAIHEERLLALFLLVRRYDKGDVSERKDVFDLYCRNMRFVNNWDSVDSSAHFIVGPFLQDRSRRLLHQLAKSDVLWERRTAIMSTFAYIKNGEFDETLKVATTLLHDKEDLIHKAVGWMLREVGNRCRDAEEEFLKTYYRNMPRTMLRYAIEKFPEQRRKRYLDGTV
jgi:3-methyladenine DNA glycosylase AlkD